MLFSGIIFGNESVLYMNCTQSEVAVPSPPFPVKFTTYCFRDIFFSIVHAIPNSIRCNIAVIKRGFVPRDIQWICPKFKGEVIRHQAPHSD